jgi:hypothetical protein
MTKLLATPHISQWLKRTVSNWFIVIRPIYLWAVANCPPPSSIAIALLDVYAGMSDDMRGLVAHDSRIQILLLALNLVARFGPHPAAHAPAPRPAPVALPSGGLAAPGLNVPA